MTCRSCSGDGILITNHEMRPCIDCAIGWQKLCFGLDFRPGSSDPYQTDIEEFIAVKEDLKQGFKGM